MERLNRRSAQEAAGPIVPPSQRPPVGQPRDFREYCLLMADIIALAFQTDRSRIATMLMSHDRSGQIYPFLNLRDDHHNYSHLVTDKYGNLVSINNVLVSLAIASGPSGAKLTGTTTVHAINGIATFGNLSLTTAGTYTLRATDGSLVAATTSFAIAPAQAAQLSFLQLPTSARHGHSFSVQVVLLDKYRNVAAANASSVTLTLGTHPKNASLAGILRAAVVKGIATFTDLSVNLASTYSLVATDKKLTFSVASKLFAVT